MRPDILRLVTRKSWIQGVMIIEYLGLRFQAGCIVKDLGLRFQGSGLKISKIRCRI